VRSRLRSKRSMSSSSAGVGISSRVIGIRSLARIDAPPAPALEDGRADAEESGTLPPQGVVQAARLDAALEVLVHLRRALRRAAQVAGDLIAFALLQLDDGAVGVALDLVGGRDGSHNDAPVAELLLQLGFRAGTLREDDRRRERRGHDDHCSDAAFHRRLLVLNLPPYDAPARTSVSERVQETCRRPCS